MTIIQSSFLQTPKRPFASGQRCDANQEDFRGDQLAILARVDLFLIGVEPAKRRGVYVPERKCSERIVSKLDRASSGTVEKPAYE
jgi:hypothetical protein